MSSHPGQRALKEIGESLRTLLTRCKTISQLATQLDPMDPVIQQSRSVGRYLESALRSIAVLDDENGSLKLETLELAGGHKRVVVRCVSSLLEGLDQEPAGALEGAAPAEPPKAPADFQGSSDTIGIPALLTFIESLGKSGMLRVETMAETFSLILDNGTVVHAASDNSPAGMRLGDILVDQGAISRRDLHHVLKSCARLNQPIGEAFVRSGVLQRDQLSAALEYQIQQLFHRLFVAEEASFSFFDGKSTPSEFGVSMSLTRLLVDSCVEADTHRPETAEGGSTTDAPAVDPAMLEGIDSPFVRYEDDEPAARPAQPPAAPEGAPGPSHRSE